MWRLLLSCGLLDDPPGVVPLSPSSRAHCSWVRRVLRLTPQLMGYSSIIMNMLRFNVNISQLICCKTDKRERMVCMIVKRREYGE
jgi:hypothetical protein